MHCNVFQIDTWVTGCCLDYDYYDNDDHGDNGDHDDHDDHDGFGKISFRYRRMFVIFLSNNPNILNSHLSFRDVSDFF